MKENIKAIVFDLDGTLVDTMGEFTDIAAKLIAGIKAAIKQILNIFLNI